MGALWVVGKGWVAGKGSEGLLGALRPFLGPEAPP